MPLVKERTHWKCRDGRVLAIVDMDTEHIKNCIAMLRAKGRIAEAELGPEPAFPCFNGEYAQMYAEQGWDAAMDDWMDAASRTHPSIDAFEAELKRRK